MSSFGLAWVLALLEERGRLYLYRRQGNKKFPKSGEALELLKGALEIQTSNLRNLVMLGPNGDFRGEIMKGQRHCGPRFGLHLLLHTLTSTNSP